MQFITGYEDQQGTPVIPTDPRNEILVNTIKPIWFLRLSYLFEKAGTHQGRRHWKAPLKEGEATSELKHLFRPLGEHRTGAEVQPDGSPHSFRDRKVEPRIRPVLHGRGISAISVPCSHVAGSFQLSFT